MKKTCGIYRIYCKETDRTYIGSSCHIEYRWTGHKRDLKNHCHTNYLIQKDYDKYGLDAFEFSIVEECDDDKKLEREKYYAETVYDCMNKKGANGRGYNIAPFIDTGYAIKQHVPHDRMSDSDVRMAKILISLGATVTSVSQFMNVKHKTINEISNLKSYKNVFSEFNDYVVSPNPYNLYHMPLSCNEFIKIFDDIYCIDFFIKSNFFRKHIPIPFEFIYDIFYKSKTKIYPARQSCIDLNNLSIFESDLKCFGAIDNDLSVACMYFILLISKNCIIGGKYISCFSEVDFVTCMKIWTNHNDYVCAIKHLIELKLIKINFEHYCFEIPFERCGDIICTISEINSIEDCFKLVKYRAGISKARIGICDECGAIFEQSKTKKSKYCKKHRANTRIGYLELKCIDCGEMFFVGSKSRMKVRCDACQKEYRKSYKREKMRESRKVRHFA